MSRRRLLAAAAAAVAALAGCGGRNAQNERNGGTASLGYVRAVNRHEAAHTMHVLVERDGEVVSWSSYDLAADGEASTAAVDGPWTEAAAEEEYTVYFRVDDRDEWETFGAGARDRDCYGLEARVNADGSLGLWLEQRPDACGEPTPSE